MAREDFCAMTALVPNPHLFTRGGSVSKMFSPKLKKGGDAHGGSGKSLLARLVGSPKRNSPKGRRAAAAVVTVSGDTFLGVASALADAAASEPAMVAALGFTPCLVGLLRHGAASEECAIAAARALAQLAAHREHHAALREALPVLTSILISPMGSPALIHAALEVLKPLSRDVECKEAMRDAGIFQPLLSQLQAPGAAAGATGTPEQRRATAELATAIVRNLATCQANQDSLRTSGAIRALVGLCACGREAVSGCEAARGRSDASAGESVESGAPPDGDGAPADFALGARAAATAAAALSNLALGNPANKAAIRQAGGIPPLVEMLSRGGDLSAAATEALGNLAARSKENKDAIRTAGGVLRLAQLYKDLRHPPPAGGTSASAAGHNKRASSTPAVLPEARAAAPSAAASPHGAVATAARTATAPAATAPTAAAAPASAPPLFVGTSQWASPPPLALADISRAAADSSSSSEGVSLITPSGAAGTRGAAARPSSPLNTHDTAERLGWALRNLVAANGLNSAVLVSTGVPLREIDNLKTPKPSTPKASPLNSPHSTAGASAAAAADGTARDAAAPAARSFGESRKGATGSSIKAPPTLSIEAAAAPAKAPKPARPRAGSKGGSKAAGYANEAENEPPAFAGIGLVNWSRGRVP